VTEFEAPQLEPIKAKFAAEHEAAVEKAALTIYGACARCRGAKLEAG
jgi:Fe2+ or Zn2+ uptake regulation protein